MQHDMCPGKCLLMRATQLVPKYRSPSLQYRGKVQAAPQGSLMATGPRLRRKRSQLCSRLVLISGRNSSRKWRSKSTGVRGSRLWFFPYESMMLLVHSWCMFTCSVMLICCFNSATPIHRGGPLLKGKPVNVPDHQPPPGYICYRCGEKG